MHQWATPGPPVAPPAPVAAPATDRARIVTPVESLWRAVAPWLVLAALPLVAALAAPDPGRTADARAVVEDIDGQRATINLVDRPQPSRFVVRWQGELREGDVVPVRLVGECGCLPVPTSTGAGRTLGDVAGPLFSAALTLSAALWLVRLGVRFRRAYRRSRAAARSPHAAVPVWARPMWVTPGPRLAIDVHEREGGARIGRFPVGPVSVEMRPWEPYVLLGGEDGAVALVSEDGSRLVLGIGPLDRTPADGRLSPNRAVLDVAMRWGDRGDDPRWSAAFRRTQVVRSVVIAVLAVEVAALVILVRFSPHPLLLGPLVLLATIAVPRLTFSPLARLVQEHTGAPRRVARRAAQVASRWLVTTGTIEVGA